MKKLLLSVLMFATMSSFVLAYEDGEAIPDDGLNYCKHLDRYNSTSITLMRFLNKNLTLKNSFYVVRMIEVGYVELPFVNATFNGVASVGSLSSLPFICPAKYNYRASGPFFAGRIIEWAIPVERGSSGELRITYVNKTISQSF